jgi:hypothetical protein
MLTQKIKVGRYYALTTREAQTIACAVLYGFERGKNKDVYTLMMYTKKGNFEFPIEEPTFDRWVSKGKIKEISAEEALEQSL